MIAITGGQVWTMADGVYSRGVILIDDGKIIDIGPGVEVPPEAEIIEADGKMIFPGFIDAHCHLGIMEEIYQVEGNDGNEGTDPITPHMRAIDAVNPGDVGFKDALSAGITTVVTSPGSANVLGGEMAVLKTRGKVVEDMVLRFPAGLKAALGENPKRNYGNDKKMPSTRMASAALLREAFIDAQNYMEKKARSEESQKPERSLKMEAIERVLKGEVPLRIHAHRADDIMTALRIGKEFGIKLVLEHCTEGHNIVDYIADSGFPAVIGPVITSRAKVELKERSLQTAAALTKGGVPVAIMTDHPVVPVHYLLLSAGLACRGGLSEDKALEAVTIGAAKIAGVDDRIGSLEKGKDADIVIMNGHPFDLNSEVNEVLINGTRSLKTN